MPVKRMAYESRCATLRQIEGTNYNWRNEETYQSHYEKVVEEWGEKTCVCVYIRIRIGIHVQHIRIQIKCVRYKLRKQEKLQTSENLNKVQKL